MALPGNIANMSVDFSGIYRPRILPRVTQYIDTRLIWKYIDTHRLTQYMFQFLRIPPFIWNIDPPIAPKNHLMTALTSKDNCADFTVRFTRKDFLSWLGKAKSSEERARKAGGKSHGIAMKNLSNMGVPWNLIERMLFSGDYGIDHQF